MDDPHAQELLELIREEHLPCPSCGYELGRLAECRCPECGAGLGIELWPGFGPAREIETFVRLRGPLRCAGCRSVMQEAPAGRCGECGRRVRLSDHVPRPGPQPEGFAGAPLAARAALVGGVALGVLASTGALLYYLGGVRAKIASRGWLGMERATLRLVILLAVVVLIPALRVRGWEPFLKAPRWYQRFVAILVWTIVGLVWLVVVRWFVQG